MTSWKHWSELLSSFPNSPASKHATPRVPSIYRYYRNIWRISLSLVGLDRWLVNKILQFYRITYGIYLKEDLIILWVLLFHFFTGWHPFMKMAYISVGKGNDRQHLFQEQCTNTFLDLYRINIKWNAQNKKSTLFHKCVTIKVPMEMYFKCRESSQLFCPQQKMNNSVNQIFFFPTNL